MKHGLLYQHSANLSRGTMNHGKSSSFDCVPQMISQTELSPLFTSQSGSLISRISRGFTSRAKNKLTNADILSPASTNFDSISTIKADDYLFDKHEDSWNIQHRNTSPYKEGKSSSPILAFSGQTPCSHPHSHDLKNITVPSVCFRNDASKSMRLIDHDITNDDPSPRHVQRMRVQGVGAAEVQRGMSVSWEISPSKEAQVETSKTEQPNETENTPSHASSVQDVPRQSRDAMDSSMPNSSKPREDQWKEAVDPESGRKYYYNRRTRESKWRIPTGAVVKKKDSSRRREQGREQSYPVESSISWQNSRRAECRKNVMHVSLSSDDDKLNSTRPSSQNKSHLLNQQSPPRQVEQRQALQKISSLEDKVHIIFPTMNVETTEFDDLESGRRIEPGQNETANQLSTANPPTSPRQGTSHAIFCLYCGCKCESVPILSSHLPQCTQFAHMQQNGRSTQIDLEITLFREWSRLSNSSSTNVVASSFSHELCTPSQRSASIRQEREAVRSSISQLSEDDIKSNPATRQTPTPRNIVKDEYAKPYYSAERKKCPFCNDVFDTGNGFSSHLLICTVRRQSRKQRRTMKKDSPVPQMFDPRRKYVTPGRRMPWE